MKTKLIKGAFAIIVLIVSSSANGQNRSVMDSTGVRHHEGFFFSFGIGPSFGHIHDNYKGSGENMIYSYSGKWDGTGVAVDMRFGGAIQPDLILTGDITSRNIISPSFKSDLGSMSTDNSITISEVTYGVGITKFFMPMDVYVGATVGAGTFVLQHNDSSNPNEGTSVRSDFGFSGILRAGKSWLLGKKWSIGAGLGYGFTRTNTADNTGSEVMKSSRLFALITCSYH